MKHLLIAETFRQARDHVQTMANYHFDHFCPIGNGLAVVLPHGRVDEIFFIIRENDFRGMRITGQIFRATNDFGSDDLWSYVMQHFRGRMDRYPSDPYTKNFSSSQQDSFQRFLPRKNPSCWDICEASIRRWNA